MKNNKKEFPIKTESKKSNIDILSSEGKRLIEITKERQKKNDELKRIDPSSGNLFVGK